jgi:hypothetical protein
MQGYNEFLSALGTILPAVLFLPIPAKSSPRSNVIELTPERRREALRRKNLRVITSTSTPLTAA